MLLELLLSEQSKPYIEGLIPSLQIALQEASVSVHGRSSYIFYIKNLLISPIKMCILKVFAMCLVLAIFVSYGTFTGFETRILLLIISSDKRNSFPVKALHILPKLGLSFVSREQYFLLFSVLRLQCNLCHRFDECID